MTEVICFSHHITTKPLRQSRLQNSRVLCNIVLVEARGVEPLSENHLSRLSPSAADPLDSPHRAPTDRLPVAVSALVMTGPTASPCSRSPLNHAPIPAAVFRVGTAA